MQPTHRPYYDGITNGDLLRHAQDLEQAVDTCNADKETLRNAVARQAKDGK